MSDDLILGVDGGGTTTVAWIAAADDVQNVLGRGTAGPSNPQAVGGDTAIGQIEQAIEASFADAGLPRRHFAAACLALAGAGREVDQTMIQQWSNRRRLTDRLRVVNDAVPVLYAAASDGCGVALISGTGSFAFGRREDGTTARAGGWGYLLGDEGSAYAIALDGLRAAVQSADGRGPQTSLLERLQTVLGCHSMEELVPAMYAPAMTRPRIAELCRVVFEARDSGDVVAAAIFDKAANDLAELVAAVALRLEWSDQPCPLAVTGGVLLNHHELGERLQSVLNVRGLSVDPFVWVPDPVVGALVIARQAAST